MKTVAIALLVLLLAACATPRRHDAPPVAGMANPASVACAKGGGKTRLHTDDAGNVTGYCQLPDGRECEEWAWYRDQQCVGPRPGKP